MRARPTVHSTNDPPAREREQLEADSYGSTPMRPFFRSQGSWIRFTGKESTRDSRARETAVIAGCQRDGRPTATGHDGGHC